MNPLAAIKTWNKNRLARRREMSLERMVLAEDPDYLILTPPHCLYLAHEMRHILERHQVRVSIGTHESTLKLKNLHHIIICAQIFKNIPPSFTAFQMEQTSSSAWFTPEYLQTLKQAETILDYSRENIDYLSSMAGMAPERIRHLPVDFTTQPSSDFPEHFKYDVAFYGNTGSVRRQKYLQEICSRFNTLIIENAHGPGLIAQLRQARCIVNIHYYEDALLETTRVYECLSNNLMVISETSRDQFAHTHLDGVVEFVEVGDIGAMVARIESVLSDESALRSRVKRNTQALKCRKNEFLESFEAFVQETLLKTHPPKHFRQVASSKIA